MMEQTQLKQLATVVETGQTRVVESYVRELLEQGYSCEQIVDCGFMEAMEIVGQKFDSGEYFITEMLMAARAVKLGCEAIREWMGGSTQFSEKKVLIGTVEGDLHDIGKNLVALVMRGSGIEVIDLGVDVPAEYFVRAVEADPDIAIVGISALLTTTLGAMKNTIQALKKSKAADRITIMVGGAPVTEERAKACGKDIIYTKSAFLAAKAAKELLTMKD